MQKITEMHIKVSKKNIQKDSINLIKDFGPEGDAYGGPGDRQITLLGEEDIKRLESDKEKGLCINRFVPNITLSGSTKELIKEMKYALGSCEIQISKISKKCHEGCLIRDEKRICLLPSTARFASILKGGEIHISDNLKEINS